MSYIDPKTLEQINNLKQSYKYKEALDLVNKILVKDPNNEEALLEVADIMYMEGNLEKAEKPIDYMLNSWKNTSMWLYVKWVLEMEKTNWNKARKFLKASLKLNEEDNPEILRCYGLCEYWVGNRQKWLTFLFSAFEQSNQLDAEVIYNLVEVNMLEHNYQDVKYYIDHFYKNRDKLNCFEKDVSYYDEKISLFHSYLENIIK